MASYAHYCLHELHIRPAEFCEMDIQERAFIIASIDIEVKNRKKQAKKNKKR